MDRLYRILIKLYLKELMQLNIGYQVDAQALADMYDLANAIDFIQNGGPTNSEILKIIAYYD